MSTHCILELYSCSPDKLDDEFFIKDVLREASDVANAQLLELVTHKFHPQGVTGFALLSESHISIHTWPETGYAAVDAFTCGNHTDPEKACRLITEKLKALQKSLYVMPRLSQMPKLYETKT